MQQMQYPNILAFVEGRMERLFINNNFRYITVVPVSNGVTWTTHAMARQITTLYKARNFQGDGVVVWIDREKRGETAEDICNVIEKSLIDAGAYQDKIHVLVADRMSENIILADQPLMRKTLNDDTYQYPGEGTHGKYHLSELMRTVGVTYRETSIGVALLKQARLAECAVHSAAVARLLKTLQFPCWWLKTR